MRKKSVERLKGMKDTQNEAENQPDYCHKSGNEQKKNSKREGKKKRTETKEGTEKRVL